jgi:hypothetical protein
VLDTAPAVNTTGLALVSAGGAAGAGIVVPVAATKNLHGVCARESLCAWRVLRRGGAHLLTPEPRYCVAPPLRRCADPSKHVVLHNPKYDDLYAPVAGPAHPYRADGLAAGQRNHPTGFVEVRASASARRVAGRRLATCVRHRRRLSRLTLCVCRRATPAGRARGHLHVRRTVQHLPRVRLRRGAVRAGLRGRRGRAAEQKRCVVARKQPKGV